MDEQHDSRAVEAALYKKAVGYEYDEDTLAPGESGEPVLVKRVRKHAAPDMAAIKFWLVNREPERWGEFAGEDAGGVVMLPRVLE